ncbi:MAG: phospholipase D family protein, partial [Acidobacteria bacterium]|nr:phospholipase D family protein [Acidobacteriota bacterium]
MILLEQGFDALAQRVALLRQARDSIDVQTFIWSDDVSGRYFFAECLAAARRGVRVRILAD